MLLFALVEILGADESRLSLYGHALWLGLGLGLGLGLRLGLELGLGLGLGLGDAPEMAFSTRGLTNATAR